MFHKFHSQDDRKKFGGSAFLELQYCRMDCNASIERLVSVHEIKRWQTDSLYVYMDDMELFFQQYADVFKNGVYNNRKTGVVDLYGINYYSPAQVNEIIGAIEKKKPMDYLPLLNWLYEAKTFNGMYILGI